MSDTGARRTLPSARARTIRTWGDAPQKLRPAPAGGGAREPLPQPLDGDVQKVFTNFAKSSQNCTTWYFSVFFKIYKIFKSLRNSEFFLLVRTPPVGGPEGSSPQRPRERAKSRPKPWQTRARKQENNLCKILNIK